MNKLCIFDFDGTLVDTISDVVSCLNEALIRNGLKPCQKEYIEYADGCRLETMVEKLIYDCHESIDMVPLVMHDYVSIYSPYSKPNTKLYPGVLGLLTELKRKGYLLAINSNKNHNSLLKLVSEMFPQKLFSSIIGNNGMIPTKPDPFGVDIICKELNTPKRNVVYIGDTQSDIDTAKNAGIPCIIAKWGNGHFDNNVFYKNVCAVENVCELYYKITVLFQK